MLRLFTALALPDELRTRLAMMAAGIDGARWVAPENLHVTLRFIGEVNEDRADDIVAALDAVRARPVTVTPGGVGHFTTGKSARAVWAAVARTPEIVALHEKVDQALIRAGFPAEGRKYTPHVTLARLRNASLGRVRNWLEANGAFCAPPFVARHFTLYESRPGHDGPAYIPAAEFPLS